MNYDQKGKSMSKLFDFFLAVIHIDTYVNST